jgi:hypothetical protein
MDEMQKQMLPDNPNVGYTGSFVSVILVPTQETQ